MAFRPKRQQSLAEKAAGREAAQQDVFLREVDDALRQDEALDMFKRYAMPVGAAVALGLAGFGGYLWWDHSRLAAAGEHGEQLTVALDRVGEGRLDLADKQLAPLAADTKGGSKAAVTLTRAGIAVQQGKQDEARRLYAAVAAQGDAPRPLRDLALLREVAASFDTLPPQQVIDRLKPLAAPGNPWFASAGELTGIAYLKLGKNDLAGPIFAAISREKDAPASSRSRARQMAGLLGVDAIDDAAKAAAGPAQ